MARQPLQLGEQHADVLHALRHLEAKQLLDAQDVAEAVRLRGEVVHPLDERDHLLPLLLFRGLLDPGVQVPDRRPGRLDGLAIELQHEAQHAMRAGVLRPHVDGHRFGAKFGHRLLDHEELFNHEDAKGTKLNASFFVFFATFVV